MPPQGFLDPTSYVPKWPSNSYSIKDPPFLLVNTALKTLFSIVVVISSYVGTKPFGGLKGVVVGKTGELYGELG